MISLFSISPRSSLLPIHSCSYTLFHCLFRKKLSKHTTATTTATTKQDKRIKEKLQETYTVPLDAFSDIVSG